MFDNNQYQRCFGWLILGISSSPFALPLPCALCLVCWCDTYLPLLWCSVSINKPSPLLLVLVCDGYESLLWSLSHECLLFLFSLHAVIFATSSIARSISSFSPPYQTSFPPPSTSTLSFLTGKDPRSFFVYKPLFQNCKY